MATPVDILYITCNRREYVERSLPALLADKGDFRVYCWDNGSTDGSADILFSYRDKRIIKRYLSPKNANQAKPFFWFLEQSQSDVIGKLDDDTLAPVGWTQKISEAVRNEKRLGMIGCWTFMPEDFERNRKAAMRKVVKIGQYQILQNLTIGFSAVLMRREVALRFLMKKYYEPFMPIDKAKMTLKGLINGWYFPLLYTEMMDDPRSKYCLMNKPNARNITSLCAKWRHFKTSQEYQKWLMEDVDRSFNNNIGQQIREYHWNHSIWKKIYRKVINQK
ncbi:MAG: glycosyltransferase family 2 protein [Omnitrophica bacterium]|nr:glycosyltransferase family 2 protein [Candidatus Omnitrophota bacterium]